MSAVVRAQHILGHLSPTQGGVVSSSFTSSQCSRVKKPVRVVVTGAAGQIGYALLPLICSGQMFGCDQPVILHLLEIEPALKALNGICLELKDSAFPLLSGVVATADASVAFKDVDACVLVGAFPRKQGMERADLLGRNADIFEKQGKAIEQYASRGVKVLVVGNPANTNCLIARHFAPSIPCQNWSALTRLDHHRAAAQIADKLNVPVETVKNVTIWGNHSATQYPDADHAVVRSSSNPDRNIAQLLDKSYLEGPFVPFVQKRGAEVIAARGSSSALSAAVAITAHMHDWWLGTAPGEWVSMGVVSDGSYGIPKGLVFSFPVTIKDGKWSIVQGLKCSEFGKKAIQVTTQELLQEKELAFGKLNIKI
eukprot:TRINITY_DN1832_c0_g1_i1.p1 TRINITY_DN1832_c0_g1~~TRINITY_DN1832_c0_g1_i1.p1  ORF type:complete len:368 (+),score=77.82 TRINITY_DN1832_c0_g1_i1:50-1153(+)